MKKILQSLIILIAVLIAHLGVATALMKAARTPEPHATPASSPPEASHAQASKPKIEDPLPVPKEQIDPALAPIDSPAQTVPEEAPDPKQALLPPAVETVKTEVPSEMPFAKESVGPPLPSNESVLKLPGGIAPTVVPEEPGAASLLPNSDSPEESEEASSPVGSPASETAPDTPAAPENTDSSASVAPPSAEQPPKPVIETAPSRENSIPSVTPSKKVFREIKLDDIEKGPPGIEESIRKNLPSAVEAFAPETIDRNDIDAVIRNAQTELRRRVNELKTSPLPTENRAVPSPASRVPAGPPAPGAASPGP